MMRAAPPSPWKRAIQFGLAGGGVGVLLALVGMVAAFGERYIVSGWFTMGQVLFLAPLLLLAYTGVRRAAPQPAGLTLLTGSVSGLLGGALLALLVLLGAVTNLREMLVNASPELFGLLTFGQGLALGVVLLLVVGLVLGAAAAGVYLLPQRFRGALIQAVMWVVLVGLLRDLVTNVIAQWVVGARAFPAWAAWVAPIVAAFANFAGRQFYAASGLRPLSAIVLFLLIGGWGIWRPSQGQSARSFFARDEQQPSRRILRLAGVSLIFILLPPVLGIFFAEILDNVGLYIMMGLGLNIVVGFAGLLDLGYVAFYAIGAYTMGVLTSPEFGFFNLTYWQALPFAMIASVLAGVVLGLPVLKMRGDYLAIVTLGFGEIVRLLALSDWLRPWLGGTQGIQRIAQPSFGGFVLNTQAELYYLFLVGIAIIAFVALRLKDSRLGRAWMALREDEDVAQAMGIDNVITKLMAFATGALFSGIAGTIFAAKLQSVYPHSMNFLVSINVLSLIIIGGMGSIPGVFVGALVLIAAPDLLREFAEYRYLAYGAVLVAMMLTRPEGLWPEEQRRLELHEAEEAAPVEEAKTEAAEELPETLSPTSIT
jgi:branched-chain amino acid transport system permease protein